MTTAAKNEDAETVITPAPAAAEQRLARVKECFLGLGADPLANIDRLTALLGEELGAGWAIYGRADGDRIRLVGRWRPPADLPAEMPAAATLCARVAGSGSDRMALYRGLQASADAETCPNIRRYGVETYCGRAVHRAGRAVGTVCALFDRDYLPSPSDEELLGIVAAAIGVEESRAAAIGALEGSRAQYRALLETLSLVPWEADPVTWRVTYMGPQAVALFGYPLESWYEDGKVWAERVHPDDRAAMVATCKAATARGENHQLEYRMLAADGRSVWVRDIVSLVREEGAPPRVRGVLIDVTKQRAAEQALSAAEEQLRQAQKMEAIGRLAGGVAHDFNNLLTAVIGHTDLLLSALHESDPARPDVDAIRDASQRAARLTRQLLAFSRKQVLQPRELDLGAIVVELAPMLRRLIGAHIHLSIDAEPGVAWVLADPSQIEQVIMNLVLNARDAIPERGGTISLELGSVELDEEAARAHPGTRAGPHVALTIADGGTGMTDEVRARIFEPFFTTKEHGKGTGLGLSTVYGIIRQSGGTIEVRSAPGRGTRFTIRLPRISPSDGSAAERDRAAAQRREREGTETVLLVEDEPAVRRLAGALLRARGYAVLEAASFDEALRASDGHPGRIHLLLADIVLPGPSGREVALALAERRPDLRVIFMSGYSEEAIAHHGVLEPGTHYMEKPFAPADLAAKVRKVLDA